MSASVLLHIHEICTTCYQKYISKLASLQQKMRLEMGLIQNHENDLQRENTVDKQCRKLINLDNLASHARLHSVTALATVFSVHNMSGRPILAKL